MSFFKKRQAGGLPLLSAERGATERWQESDSTLPQMPFPGLGIKPRPEKRRGCGNCGLAFSAPGGAKPQFPLRLIHYRSPRVRAGALPNATGRPKGGLSHLVESGGLEPSTFRV